MVAEMYVGQMDVDIKQCLIKLVVNVTMNNSGIYYVFEY